MINPINTNQRVGGVQPITAITTQKVEKDAPITPVEQIAKKDTLEIGKSQDTIVTYSNMGNSKKIGTSEIEALKAQADTATETLRRLVEKLILQQNENSKILIEGGKNKQKEIKLSLEEIEELNFSISEEGPLGVKAVSDRLVDFAIAVSGGDKTKLATLTAAIDEGFAAAKEALGGSLPDISQKTYDETMRKLQDCGNS